MSATKASQAISTQQHGTPCEFLFNPLLFENSQVLRFYEKNSVNSTPTTKRNLLLRLINSPLDTPSNKFQHYYLNRHNDLWADYIDQPPEATFKTPISSRKPFENRNSVLRQSSPKMNLNDIINTSTQQNMSLYYRKKGSSVKKRRMPLANITNDFRNFENAQTLKHKAYGCKTSSALNGIHDKENIPFELDDLADSQDGRKTGNREGDVRKRKRKSNQQLKILKWEFEKDGFWNKDKIISVAKITGLSESQVYKWCWDQKKKKHENGSKPDLDESMSQANSLLFDTFEEKENINFDDFSTIDDFRAKLIENNSGFDSAKFNFSATKKIQKTKLKKKKNSLIKHQKSLLGPSVSQGLGGLLPQFNNTVKEMQGSELFYKDKMHSEDFSQQIPKKLLF